MENDIFGAAITDYFETRIPNSIIVKSNEFDDDEIPIPYLFRTFNEMPKVEQKALDLSFGKVLDVGCGAGSHSLHLQNEKKLTLTAIDTSAGAVEICKKRGVTTVLNEDFYIHQGTYDTILLLMNGSGIVGTLTNFASFFNKLKSLLTSNGQILIDSSDLIYLFEDENGEYWVDAAQGYYGEMQYQLEYKNKTSQKFDWLYVDYNTLQRAAAFNNFNCELIIEGAHYDYLARLTL
ncbi:class I SAM-dependent methyltransferase [Aquimarina agarilytica]|uniref:class I SAM-dependent methyltransferase n=1 Tax=Aquimarina agarilytica TaxID=1087449 RepID=UPI000288A413|nr:class I SAM-dependent methyltransferase [Aquimarina agarilytica]